MDVTIFYAWQSDSPHDRNWKLIQKAANNACAQITADTSNDWNVMLDHDTKGVPGMCDIPKEILAKIRHCDIFLADLTLVGRTDTGKSLPNANVVFELGYAARRMGFRPLVGVVNEAYGKIEGQIFDIKRRACVKYNTDKAKTNSDLDKVAAKLSEKLKAVFRETIEKVILPMRGGVIAAETRSASDQQSQLADRVLKGDFHGIQARPVVATSFLFAPQPQIDYETIGAVVRQCFQANPRVDAESYAWGGNGDVTEFSPSGYLHRVRSMDRRSAILRMGLQFIEEPPPEPLILETRPLVANIAKGVRDLAVFLNRVGVKPPFQIAISIVGGRGFDLVDVPGDPAPRKVGQDVMKLPIQRVVNLSHLENVFDLGAVLKPAFDYLIRSVGWEYNWCYTSDGKFDVRLM